MYVVIANNKQDDDHTTYWVIGIFMYGQNAEEHALKLREKYPENEYRVATFYASDYPGIGL